MNEEEKEVIKNIKLELEMTVNMPRLIFNRNDIESILKLIEKQQKEIENKEDDFTTVYMKGFYDGLNKFKDTIKEKIEELESVLDLAENDKRFAKYKKEALKEEIEDLKELLGES